MQVANPVATRSVGENAAPRPLLSLGASVDSPSREGPWTAEQWRSPWYSPVILTMPGLSRLRPALHPGPWLVGDERGVDTPPRLPHEGVQRGIVVRTRAASSRDKDGRASRRIAERERRRLAHLLDRLADIARPHIEGVWLAGARP